MIAVTIELVARLKTEGTWVHAEALYGTVHDVHYIDALMVLNILYHAGTVRRRGFGQHAEYCWIG